MVMIAINIIIYIYIIFFDLIPIKKNNYNKLFIFNLLILAVSFLLVILVGLEIKVPNPSDFIENIVNAIV